MPRTTKLEREKRRARVSQYQSRGLGVSEIAKLEGVTRQTIYNDMEAINKKFQEQMSEKEEAVISDFLLEVLNDYDVLKRSYWKLHLQSESNSNKIGALNGIQRLDKEKMSILQSAGLQEQVALKIKHEGSLTYDEIKKRLSEIGEE